MYAADIEAVAAAAVVPTSEGHNGAGDSLTLGLEELSVLVGSSDPETSKPKPKTSPGYKPGDVIHDYSDAFVKNLFDPYKGKRCDTCFKESSALLRCSNCKVMYYCGRSCQSKDWKDAHTLECKSNYFLKINASPSSVIGGVDFIRQIIRLFAFLKLHPKRASQKILMYDGTHRCFHDLIAHQATLGKDIRFFVVLAEMAKNLRGEDNIESVINTPDSLLTQLFTLAGVWKTNAFAIQNESENANIGSGIYIEPSYFDHSCRPTAITRLIGCQFQIRAIATIPPGQAPLTSYLAGHRSRAERQAILKERYNFDCKCSLCEEEVHGDVIDYKELNQLIGSCANIYDWKVYNDTADNIVRLMQRCYYEYDERITNHKFLSFQEVASLGATPAFSWQLAIEAEQAILKTFGEDSTDYQKLQRVRVLLGLSDTEIPSK